MNFLLSIFILFLSHAAYCSENERPLLRSDSTDTVDVSYTTEKHATELEKKYKALKFRNAQSEIQLEQARLNNAALTAQNTQLNQQLQDYENEEFVDLSCSIVGPKFYILPCFKSQPLPKYIDARKTPMSSRVGQSLHYYNTKTQTPICKLQSSDCCDRCFLCVCCIQRKLPYYLGIRPDSENPQSRVYYDKRDNSMQQLEGVSGWTYQNCYENCYINCCCKRAIQQPVDRN